MLSGWLGQGEVCGDVASGLLEEQRDQLRGQAISPEQRSRSGEPRKGPATPEPAADSCRQLGRRRQQQLLHSRSRQTFTSSSTKKWEIAINCGGFACCGNATYFMQGETCGGCNKIINFPTEGENLDFYLIFNEFIGGRSLQPRN